MSAIPYDEPDREGNWDDEPEEQLELPGRRRRRFLNRWSVALLVALACGAGFYGGVRVEKGQLASGSSPAGSFSPSALGGSTTRSSSAATGSGAGRTRSGSTGGFPTGGGFPGAAFAGGGTSIGTISSVAGNSVYVTETSGDVVKVTLSSATTITKSLGVSKRSLRPGDSVVIQGAKGANGTVSATSVSDSGASNTSSSGSSGSSSSGSSAVGSLFGSSGGG